ncbi:MAG: hypothetical protein WC712_00565 [Candidatus Brocadiia bacterium]
MKKLLLLFFVVAFLLSPSMAQGEQFVLGLEQELTYRTEHDLTMRLPILNGNLWPSAQAVNSSTFHYAIDEHNGKVLFMHMLFWKQSGDQKDNLKNFALEQIKQLVAIYPDKTVKWNSPEDAGDPGPPVFLDSGYQVYSYEFKVVQLLDAPAETDPGAKKKPVQVIPKVIQLQAMVRGLLDPETQKFFVMLAVGNEDAYSSVAKLSKDFTYSLHVGKVSSAGLVILLLVLLAMLIGGGLFFFANEQKKEKERKRRLANMHEEEYVDDDYDDDYDDGRGAKRSSGRGGRQSDPPSRSSARRSPRR